MHRLTLKEIAIRLYGEQWQVSLKDRINQPNKATFVPLGTLYKWKQDSKKVPKLWLLKWFANDIDKRIQDLERLRIEIQNDIYINENPITHINQENTLYRLDESHLYIGKEYENGLFCWEVLICSTKKSDLNNFVKTLIPYTK